MFAKSTEVLLSASAGICSGFQKEDFLPADQLNQYLDIRTVDENIWLFVYILGFHQWREYVLLRKNLSLVPAN